MKRIIGVRLQKYGKIIFCKSEERLKVGTRVIIKKEDDEVMIATVITTGLKNGNLKSKNGMATVVRKAVLKEIKKSSEQLETEKKAFDVCRKNILRLNLPMRLIKTKAELDTNKIVFYFTADGRVDFRELVRVLANIFKVRIELRQVGVRDKARVVGGFGICGKEFCCNKFSTNFQPVSVKMAKEQGLSLSPGKISGMCGRLMCCLSYEHETYEELIRRSPKVGAVVDTPGGRGVVTEVNLLKGALKVSLSSGENIRPVSYEVKDVKLVKDKAMDLEKKEEWEKLKKPKNKR